MKARYFRLLVGMGTLMVYTAAAGWMVLSIAKPAPPDAIGVPCDDVGDLHDVYCPCVFMGKMVG